MIPAVPDDLVAACERTGLPLFEVPYRTPFLAIARACADANAAHAFARRSWALAAQRSVSLAALRSDPLPAAIGELAHQFDAAGGLSVARPTDLPETAAVPLADAVSRMLDAGGRSADTVTIRGSAFSVQTLGRGGSLRGALAISAADVDQEARGVITTVVAGLVSDRIGRRRGMVCLSGVVMTVPALALAVSPVWTTGLICAVLFGVGFGIFLSVDNALVTQVLPTASGRAKDLGIVNIASAGPQVIAPALAGPIVVHLGGYSTLYTVCGMLTLLGGILVWRIKGVP